MKSRISFKLFLILLIVFSAVHVFYCPGISDSLIVQESFQTISQRSKMTQEQIEKRGIKSKQVLDAFRKVPRHLFVMEKYRSMAYADRALPIGKGQTISQPYIVAFMTEALSLKSTDRILEVGTGSGYQAAILSEICDTVYSIEIIDSLSRNADNLLKKIGYSNVKIKIGDGYLGWKEHAPFDAIIVTCAPTQIPVPLKNQLAEAGRMIIPVGERYVQELILMEKKNGRLIEKKVLPVLFVPMVDEHGKSY